MPSAGRVKSSGMYGAEGPGGTGAAGADAWGGTSLLIAATILARVVGESCGPFVVDDDPAPLPAAATILWMTTLLQCQHHSSIGLKFRRFFYNLLYPRNLCLTVR
jgi:hypothetical protein